MFGFVTYMRYAVKGLTEDDARRLGAPELLPLRPALDAPADDVLPPVLKVAEHVRVQLARHRVHEWSPERLRPLRLCGSQRRGRSILGHHAAWTTVSTIGT